MKKTILLMIIVMVLLSFNVLGALADYTALAYYSFDSDLTNLGNTTGIDWNGTVEGYSAGIVGNAVSIESTDVGTSSLPGAFSAQMRTIDFWVKFEDLGKANNVLSIGNSSSDYSDWQNPGTDQFEFYMTGTPDTYMNTGAGTGNTKWNHWVIVFDVDNTDSYMYLNGVLNDTDTDSFGPTSAWDNMRTGDGDGSNTLDGMIDNLFITDSVYNAQDVIDSYNGGLGYDFSVTSSTNQIVTLISPTDTLITNTDQNSTFNYTGFTADNCYLYDNRTGTFALNKTIGSPTENVTQIFNFTGLNDGNYLWNTMCTNGTEYWGASNYTLTIDTTKPEIVLSPNNFFNANNYSTKNQYDDNITINITFNDERDLYAMSINITRDGTIYFNITNTSLSGLSFVYNITLNTSTWGNGVYDIELITSDSHTDELIENYLVSKYNKNLEFDTTEGNNIKVYSEDDAITNAIKLKNRYEFEFNFADKLIKDRVFHIESNNKISYRIDSDYKAHFVVWNGRNGNWIDFEGIHGEPIIKKISDYHYTVTFKNTDSYMKFNSIGGLNIVTENYIWYRGTHNLIAPTGAAGENVLFSLNITINNSMANFDADLFYNSVLQTNNTKTNYSEYISFNKTISSGDPGTVDYYWNVTVIQGDGTIIRFNLNGEHTVTSWDLYNCTGGNISLTMNIYDEESVTTPLEADVEIVMEYWITSQSNSQNFSVQMNGSNKYNICLTKPDLTIYTDTYIKYTTKNGFTHRYYLINQPLTNTTLNISMYNFDTQTDISDLRITTRKFDYTYLPNVIGKLQRRYVGEDVWRTVQMDESGDYGLIFFDIKEEDTDYRIIFQDRSNNILKTTDSMKFSCTTSLCEIVFLLDPYSATAISPGLDYNAIYDNSTGIITLTWNDPLGLTSTVRLLVTKETMAGSLTICDEEKSGASGTTTCNVGSYTGMLLMKIYSSASPEESIFTKWIDVRRQILGSLISTTIGSTEGVIWTFGILVTIVMTGLISPVFALISMVFGLIVLFFFGIFTPLTLTFVIVTVILSIIIGIRVRK